jgi:feruloyl esterase
MPAAVLTLFGLVAGAATAQGVSTAANRPNAGDMACNNLAAVALANHGVLTATASVVAATSTLPAYCQVNLEESPAINIEVRLPLNARDGGTGGSADGAWNGTLLDLGNRGYAGSIPSIAMALNRGDVGDSTDNGHSPAWCNAINPRTGQPNSQPNCGEAGGGFVLNPSNQLLKYQVTDFIKKSELDQTLWDCASPRSTTASPRSGTTGSASRLAAARAGRWRRATPSCSMGSSSGSQR